MILIFPVYKNYIAVFIPYSRRTFLKNVLPFTKKKKTNSLLSSGSLQISSFKTPKTMHYPKKNNEENFKYKKSWCKFSFLSTNTKNYTTFLFIFTDSLLLLLAVSNTPPPPTEEKPPILFSEKSKSSLKKNTRTHG